MDASEFRRRGKEMVDMVADYLENIRDRRPLSNVQPGYLQKLIPEDAPDDPETWDDVMKDVERVIMPGVTHWHHPNFHAYYPTASSYPAICADLLSDAIGCIGFSWISSPACTELEVVVMDWLAKMIKLPEYYLSGGKGGGVIQGTASEATLVGLLAGKSQMISRLRKEKPEMSELEIQSKLVAYTSDQAHSSVERACLLGAVKCHKVDSGEDCALTGADLHAAIMEDKEKGLIPFFVCATLGTTPSCAFDRLTEIGPVCRAADVWLHVDAAYAGSAFICPEFRPLLDGVEFSDSFNFNPHKLLLVNFDCSAMWFKDSTHVVDAFNVDPLYLKHDHQGKVPDYRHVRLAKEFEAFVKKDSRFEVTNDVTLGLVCFRLKGRANEESEALLKMINDDGRIHMVPSKSKGVYYIRFVVCAASTESADVALSSKVVAEVTDKYLASKK